MNGKIPQCVGFHDLGAVSLGKLGHLQHVGSTGWIIRTLRNASPGPFQEGTQLRGEQAPESLKGHGKSGLTRRR
jgi:hypothetical protein